MIPEDRSLFLVSVLLTDVKKVSRLINLSVFSLFDEIILLLLRKYSKLFYVNLTQLAEI